MKELKLFNPNFQEPQVIANLITKDNELTAVTNNYIMPIFFRSIGINRLVIPEDNIIIKLKMFYRDENEFLLDSKLYQNGKHLRDEWLPVIFMDSHTFVNI